jgi:hypothetical protein
LKNELTGVPDLVALDAGLFLFGTQGELKHGPSRFIRAGANPSSMRLDNRMADGKAHALRLGGV